MRAIGMLLPAGFCLLVASTTGCGSKKEFDKGHDTFVAQKQDKGVAEAPDPGKGAEAAKDVPRKIKYSANVRLITADFSKDEEALKGLVAAHKGYIAHSDIKTSPGAIRQGLWKIRVPVKEFDAFREAALKIGEVESNTSDSEDVTEEYYDLENHIKNRLAEEDALRKLLERVEKTADKEKLETILGVRRELNAVRDDIQRKQGRLNLLANLTDMTTITGPR